MSSKGDPPLIKILIISQSLSDVVSGYEEAGAAGLSILTNKKYFDGDT